MVVRPASQGIAVRDRGGAPLARVLVDLTPLEPGAAQGGLKPLTLELIDELSRLAPDVEFTVFGAAGSAGEGFDGRTNVRWILESADTDAEPPSESLRSRLFRAGGGALPGALRRKLLEGAWARGSQAACHPAAIADPPDVVFSPLMGVRFYTLGAPVVATIPDIQFHDHPEFFPDENRWFRQWLVKMACRYATRIVCISDHALSRLQQEYGIPRERLERIYPVRRPEMPPTVRDTAESPAVLGFKGRRYLLYPANYWPHKNHGNLLTALRLYCDRHPHDDLGLVLTGADGGNGPRIDNEIERLRLREHVITAGYVSQSRLQALLLGASALVFPSLYEGFGMPVLEALAAGVPVLCSASTSLPEVAGDAAIYFDPQDPSDIAQAIEQLLSEPALAARLRAEGPKRASIFGNVEDMARRYLETLQTAHRCGSLVTTPR